MSKKFTLESAGIEVEIGKHALQADGSVWIRSGKTVLLATAVASKEQKEYMGFFPLTIEYRERPVAAGKFPGGYIKREGRLSDAEVLASRTIDRGIRPLFPKFYFNEVQVMSSLLSSDGSFPGDILGVIGSSLALTISGLPFLGPIGAVEVTKVDGKWLLNAEHSLTNGSLDHFVVVGTANGICMVEGHCDHREESELLDVLAQAHDEIKKQVEWQLEIKKELGVETKVVASTMDWDGWAAKVKAVMPNNWNDILFAANKESFGEQLSAAKTSVKDNFKDAVASGEISSKELGFLFDLALKEKASDVISKAGKRFDGRKFDEIRNISSEVGFLPCVHGSSLFTRGDTQALSSISLGAAQDAQKVEKLLGEVKERNFMLHYNFPPYSTGEVRFLRGVGRREIGHGYLAEMSFYNVLPDHNDFPYTIRSVVDVLSSNGSSSMAAVCSTTLSLMDAGVPLKEMVAGIAMGLLQDSDGKYFVISDILGSEDAYGLMDFKITGSESGILAFQMDIKARDGLPREVLTNALESARAGRLHILSEMKKTLQAPRADVAETAPRVTTIKIDKEKIGLLIGPGGKTIKDLTARTETSIDIDDDGVVKIFAKSKEKMEEAKSAVKALGGDI
ncbi:polyribonucleotide nucleotidyltransferase [Candidatus Babeliales bacterium]|nr:polyribonucleotide nucleotidyltransferase [Candidatus Babeliales bacterium]